MTAPETERRMRKIRTRLSTLYSYEHIAATRGRTLSIVTLEEIKNLEDELEALEDNYVEEHK